MKRKIKKMISLFLTVSLAGVVCSGCVSSDAPVSDSTRPETSGAESGTEETTPAGNKKIIIGSGQTCGTMDPLESYDAWYTVRFGIGQTLTKMNTDLSISGWLVEDDYAANEDHTVWTFTIKEGVTFSNGNPVDAAAVKASIENVCENCARAQDYFVPVSVEANGQILTITTEEAEPILPNKLADPLFVIIDTSADMTDIVDEGPIGTGPFVCQSFDNTTKECVVAKNENYWGGEVKADVVDFIYTEDQSTLSLGLQVGDFDAVYNISMTDIEAFEADDMYSVSKTASGRTTHGFMNQNGVLGDPVLREVILEMIDKDTICATQLKGQYVAGKTLVTSAANYGYDELTDPFAYNPEHAVQILDEAGYVDIDGDGYRETPDGEQIDLKFTYYTGRPEQEIVVEAIQMALSTIGIKCTPDVHDTQTVIDLLANGEYDMLCMSINVLNCADPENHMISYFMTGGANAKYGWSNAEFDSLMKELHVTADPDKRIELVKDCEQILLDEAVCIYFCYPLMNFVMKSNVSGIESTPADYYWINENTDIR